VHVDVSEGGGVAIAPVADIIHEVWLEERVFHVVEHVSLIRPLLFRKFKGTKSELVVYRPGNQVRVVVHLGVEIKCADIAH
jgi:hypothetical protein